jgi:hypothetical protein
MNKKRYKYIYTNVLLAVALLSGCVRADSPQGRLIIEEGFESGVLPFKKSGNAPEVIKVADARAGQYVMKSELNRYSRITKRTEVSIRGKNLNFDVGKEYWVGISIKLGEEFRDRRNFNDQGMLLQWHYWDRRHPGVRAPQPLVLRFKNDKVHVQNEVLRKKMASVSPAFGEWVDWVIHVKFADKDGIIQVWRNGKRIVDWRGDNHQTVKREGAYLKFGLYSVQYKAKPLKIDYKRVVYHDELRIAGADGSYELVAPKGNRLSENTRMSEHVIDDDTENLIP